jgi:hypothetical protein
MENSAMMGSEPFSNVDDPMHLPLFPYSGGKKLALKLALRRWKTPIGL